MTRSSYELATMGETSYTHGGKYKGLPKRDLYNWISAFMSDNQNKNIKDVLATEKFKMQEQDYHYMTVTLSNGLKHFMLFYKDQGCCWSSYGVEDPTA